jgi:type I restriction enzyme, S subunit
VSETSTRVGDVLKLVRRDVAVDPVNQYLEIGIRSFGKGIFHKEPIQGVDLGAKRVFKIEPSDLVLSNVFAWEGAIAVAGESDAGRIGSHRFMTFVPSDDRIDVRWASWFFLSETGLDLIRKASPGSAGRNKTLAIERFKNLEIPLPPIAKQQATARKLDSLNSVAARVFAEIDGTAEAFSQVLPAMYDQIVLSAQTTTTVLSDVVDFVSDTVHVGDDTGGAKEFVGLQHVDGHTGLRLGSDPIDGLKGRKFRFRPGDIVYGYLRPYLNKVWLADRHGLCSVDQYVLRPKAEVNAELLAFALRGRLVLDRSIDLTHNLQLPRLRSALLAASPITLVHTPDSGDGLVGYAAMGR